MAPIHPRADPLNQTICGVSTLQPLPQGCCTSERSRTHKQGALSRLRLDAMKTTDEIRHQSSQRGGDDVDDVRNKRTNQGGAHLFAGVFMSTKSPVDSFRKPVTVAAFWPCLSFSASATCRLNQQMSRFTKSQPGMPTQAKKLSTCPPAPARTP